MPITTWTCLGNPLRHLEELQQAAETDGWIDAWTINPRAEVGDTALFYLTGESSFVASGIVASQPERGGEKSNWPNHHMVGIEDVAMLSEPMHLRDAKVRFPDWGWLRSPMQSSRVPDDAAAAFEALADAEATVTQQSAEQREAEAAVVEGERYEVTSWHRRRDVRLRRAAFEAAGGTCAACGTDFTDLFGDAIDSSSVLHVHHLHPLGERVAAEETKPDDLAVVCANCHALLHAGEELLTPEDLRELWTLQKGSH